VGVGCGFANYLTEKCFLVDRMLLLWAEFTWWRLG
jgi:hypothetical protein